MARTEHLPIYKASYDLCLYLEQVVHGFSRYHKYTLGTDLHDAAGRALKLVVRANAQRDRVVTSRRSSRCCRREPFTEKDSGILESYLAKSESTSVCCL
jgi:hypothetical protein